MSPHRIHLRGPWEVAGPWPNGVADEPRRVHLPACWQDLFGQQGGVATFARWFHQPTNLTPADRLAIVLLGVSGSGRATLNGAPLGEFAAAGATIVLPLTLDRLQRRNRLEIALACSTPRADQPDGLYDAVALQIESD